MSTIKSFLIGLSFLVCIAAADELSAKMPSSGSQVLGQNTAKVIVNLAFYPNIAERIQADPASRQKLRAEIRARQDLVLQDIPAGLSKLRHRFDNVPAFSAEVSAEALRILEQHPLVDSIEPVFELQPHLAQGISLMNAAQVRTNYSGQGVAIAICDTGVDYTHPALGGSGFPNGKVIGGYDFGDNDANPFPNTQAHGTACAGIAAGDATMVGDYIGGVADSAKLYALKITSGTGGSAYSDDMAAAWDWCVTHQYDDPVHPILVISTSFGSGRNFNPCDGYSSAVTTAANNAVAAGITVLVSSGNDGYCNALSWPSCVSSVLSVGAVYDAPLGTYGFCVDDASCAVPGGTFTCSTGEFATRQATGFDVVAVYSNTASFLDVLAPSHDAYTTDIVGSSGYSSGDYDDAFGGTSAACPYAAGAVACIQSAAMSNLGEYLTPAEIKQMLTAAGDPVTDGKVNITKPRINVGTAVLGLLTGQPPTAQNMHVAVPADTAVTIELQATDDGLPNPPGALSFTITSLPGHGMLTEPNGLLIETLPHPIMNHQGHVIYMPRPGCAVPASFTFIADDGGTAPDGGASNEAVVSLHLTNVIYAANMDTDPGWTLSELWAWGIPSGSGGAMGNPDPASGVTGSAVVGYNLAGDYKKLRTTEWAVTPAIDCSNQTAVSLRFYRWLNVEEPKYDHAYVQVSNTGSTWTTLWENTSEVTDANWTYQQFDISAAADNQPTVYIRWGMGITDNLWHYSGWNLDDVEVSGAQPIIQAGDFEPDCDVDIDDLSRLIAYWLQVCGDCGNTDLVADGIVNLEDFAVLAENWLIQ